VLCCVVIFFGCVLDLGDLLLERFVIFCRARPHWSQISLRRQFFISQHSPFLPAVGPSFGSRRCAAQCSAPPSLDLDLVLSHRPVAAGSIRLLRPVFSHNQFWVPVAQGLSTDFCCCSSHATRDFCVGICSSVHEPVSAVFFSSRSTACSFLFASYFNPAVLVSVKSSSVFLAKDLSLLLNFFFCCSSRARAD
jgi:hypothetical protein